MNRTVFLDSAYPIALIVPNDEHRPKALELAKVLKAERPKLITTRAVFMEIGDSLSKVRYRKEASLFLRALESDPNIEIIPLTELLYRQSFEMYQNRPDKDWGLTDCISFVIMQEHGVTQALAADEHFDQAGFNALLRK